MWGRGGRLWPTWGRSPASPSCWAARPLDARFPGAPLPFSHPVGEGGRRGPASRSSAWCPSVHPRAMWPTDCPDTHSGWKGRRAWALAVAGQPAPMGLPLLRSKPAQPPLGALGRALLPKVSLGAGGPLTPGPGSAAGPARMPHVDTALVCS